MNGVSAGHFGEASLLEPIDPLQQPHSAEPLLRPLQQPHSKPVRQMFVSVGGTFAAIYNFTNIGYALQQLTRIAQHPPWDESAASSVALWGAVVGMNVLGFVGDRTGRATAMTLTLSLVVLGALGSAAVPLRDGDAAPVATVTAWRFLLGTGLGGIFPLSAVANAEALAEDGTSRHRRVAWGMTGVFGAMILTPLIMFLIEWTVPNPAVAWRVMLGTGALPALLVMLANRGLTDSVEFRQARRRAAAEHKRGGLLRALRSRQNLVGVAAAGGSWFCLDYLWYGISVSMPAITKDVFHESSDARGALINVALTIMAVPGCLLSIWAIDPRVLGCRGTQLASFAYQATCFAALAAAYAIAPDNRAVTGAVYAATVFSLLCGASVTTYVLPQALFPPEDRSTLNGVSAALAKIGGALGVSGYRALKGKYSLSVALCGCMTSAIVGFAITYVCVPTSVDELPPSARSVDIAGGIRDSGQQGAQYGALREQQGNAVALSE